MSSRRGVAGIVVAAVVLVAPPTWAQKSIEPVKQVAIYVQPYYEAAGTPEGQPRVAVAKKYDALLASPRAEDVLAVRDAIEAEPDLITPMTLMVLAIRLYDVGRRDDSVVWFYAAKDRFLTVAEVLDTDSPELAQVEQAVHDFATLAGQVINGYAFCDVARQKELARRALEWVEKHPYRALFLPALPARPGDRQANLARALAHLHDNARKEAEYLEQPENLEQLRAARAGNGADQRFCWSAP
jgi:hypothetical protein